MEIRKSQYLVHEEYLDAIVRIRNNFDPKLISFLKNDDLFRPIVNLNDFFGKSLVQNFPSHWKTMQPPTEHTLENYSFFIQSRVASGTFSFLFK